MNPMDQKPTQIGIYKLHYDRAAALEVDPVESCGINASGCRYSYWNGEHFCTTEHTLDEALRDGDRQNDSADVYGTCVVIGWERAL